MMLLALLLGAVPARAADWQWSVPLTDIASSENNDHPRAFLWIPPGCQRVRAVVVGQHNMEEEPILEHPKFREAMAKLGIAEIWITPALDLFFRFDKGAGEHFNAMMAALAEESGYRELKFAPVIPMGHSAAASFPWNFAAWNPERTLAVLSVSGQWPYYKDTNTPDWGNRLVDDIPGLVSMGDYEGAAGRAEVGLRQRQEHPRLALTMLANPAAGHFDASDEKIAFLALYISKAAAYRLPADAPLDHPVVLKPVDPTKQGWLVDRWRPDNPPKFPAAAVGSYTGDKKDAFWCFDGEIAHAIETFGSQYRGKKADLVGYVQAGGIAPQNPNLHAQVNLKFEPGPDGLTFKLTGAFLDTVPPGRPEGWTGLKAGSPIAHVTDGSPIVISRICGPVAQVGPDTFAIRFYRMGMNNTKRSNEIWLAATHPGDAQYKRAVQQSVLHFPLRNTVGAEQRITFPKIADQRASVKTLTLAATSSARVPVYYYVREGPAEFTGDNTLTLTAIPPRAKFPVKVTVVAWQWGRSIDPKLKTAEPVEQTFLLTR
ncbi:MAG: hypothetical protein JF599_06400 [Verrucomicrobia bacterium]|nr:hypothetical protein [Verrucomicrobiota bacterium]